MHYYTIIGFKCYKSDIYEYTRKNYSKCPEHPHKRRYKHCPDCGICLYQDCGDYIIKHKVFNTATDLRIKDIADFYINGVTLENDPTNNQYVYASLLRIHLTGNQFQELCIDFKELEQRKQCLLKATSFFDDKELLLLTACNSD